MDRSITFLTSYPDSGPRLSTPRIAYRLVFDRAIYLSDTYHQELRQDPRHDPGPDGRGGQSFSSRTNSSPWRQTPAKVRRWIAQGPWRSSAARCSTVAGDEVPLGAGQRGERDEIRDDELGEDGERRQGRGHRAAGGLEDVDPVDRLVVHDADADGERLLADDVEELFASLGREQLRVGEPADPPVGCQDHRRRHDRARQRPAPRLVDPDDAPHARAPGPGFVAVRRRGGRRHA